MNKTSHANRRPKIYWLLAVVVCAALGKGTVGAQAGAGAGSPVRVALGNRLLTVGNGRLVAVDLKTNKTLWSYGTDLAPTLAVWRDRAFVLSRGSSQVAAIAATNGARVWARRVPALPSSALFVLADLLLLDGVSGSASAGVAYDPRTGEERWRAPQGGSRGPVAAFPDVIVWSLDTIQVSVTSFKGLDARTGAVRWSVGGYLAGADGQYLFVERNRLIPTRPPSEVSVMRVEGRSGRISDLTLIVPPRPSCGEVEESGVPSIVTGGALWAVRTDACGVYWARAAITGTQLGPVKLSTNGPR